MAGHRCRAYMTVGASLQRPWPILTHPSSDPPERSPPTPPATTPSSSRAPSSPHKSGTRSPNGHTSSPSPGEPRSATLASSIARARRRTSRTFVGRVKGHAMARIALAFIEPAPAQTESGKAQKDGQRRQWDRFEKVGEVVEGLRRLGELPPAPLARV
ncbi:hypothetical protein C8Q74DRAFT_415936 [Fomes fomentarius]|nr:hypothetical protein C8Q74DRAFT_415936 [Fomes fomentarius]